MKPHPWRAESLPIRPTNLKKICWIPKATNSIPFPSLRNKRFKRFREAMIERDARILFEGHLWLPSFIQLTLFWVRSLAIELKVSICPVQDSVMALVSWSNPEFLQQQPKITREEKNLRVLNLQDFNKPDLLKLHLPGLVWVVGSHCSTDRHFFGIKKSHAGPLGQGQGDAQLGKRLEFPSHFWP